MAACGKGEKTAHDQKEQEKKIVTSDSGGNGENGNNPPTKPETGGKHEKEMKGEISS